MKYRNILLSALTTIVALMGVLPCGAKASDEGRSAALEQNKSLARRVYEEGLNQGRFEVPYSEGFVGHGGARTFTHAEGMAEARGWRQAFPDLDMRVDKLLAEQDLVAVRWTARGTNTARGTVYRRPAAKSRSTARRCFAWTTGASPRSGPAPTRSG